MTFRLIQMSPGPRAGTKKAPGATAPEALSAPFLPEHRYHPVPIAPVASAIAVDPAEGAVLDDGPPAEEAVGYLEIRLERVTSTSPCSAHRSTSPGSGS